MYRNKLNIGLFGFGCVGYGLYQVLADTPTLQASIKKICVKNRNKQREIENHHFTYDPFDLLYDPDINVIVELIDDANAAYQIVKTALQQGKAVVSANKKMLADNFNELLILQEKAGVQLLYEAACCASIPIIRNLEEYYDNDLLESLEGIINGSTNYILTRTVQDGLSYPEALRQAQKKGYAESNPILDTGGYDAKYKLIILLAHAFGLVVKPQDVFNCGIDRIGELELAYAREKGWKIKLTANAYKTEDGKIAAYVIPKFIDNRSNLFNVDDVFNGVVTRSVFSDQQTFIGKGAGAYPTASAVISDLSALSYGYRYEYKKLQHIQAQQLNNEVLLSVLLRSNVSLFTLHALSFINVQERYNNGLEGYIIGLISLKALQELLDKDAGASVIMMNDNYNTNLTAQAMAVWEASEKSF